MAAILRADGFTSPHGRHQADRDIDRDIERQSSLNTQFDDDLSKSETSPTTDYSDEKNEFDGHRPTNLEIYLSRTRSRVAAAHDTKLEQKLTRRPTALQKVRSTPLVSFKHPLAHLPTTEDVIVDFAGKDDPYRPINWPTSKKVCTTALYGFITMTASWASSSYAAGTIQVMREFHVGSEVATLGTTLFLFGFGLGPLLWAPCSELFGRRLAVMVPVFVGMCFSFGSATAKDFQTLMLTRFFGGFFSSAPVTNTGGVLGDLYSPAYRGIAMAGYATAVVAGPCLSPIVSSALVVQPQLGWRWTEYLTGIIQGFFLLLGVIYIDETYPAKLLVVKAARLRHETGNWALHAKFEEWDVSLKEMINKFGVRPVQLLVTPICFLMALYASFCYGILYMQLGAIPIIFGEIRGWKPFVAELPFLGILLGTFVAAGANVYNQKLYNKYYHAAGDRAVPEKRLPPMMLGSFFFAGGQFLTGWTTARNIPWIVPVLGLFIMAIGFFMIFQAALNYLVDTFQPYAASAIAANTFLRSLLAGAFPLVVRPMYHNIGTGPGSSITGGFAALLIPVPFVFYIYGERIRAGSKWSKASVF